MVLPLASMFFLANFWGLPEKIELEISHLVVPGDSFGDEDISIQIVISNNTGYQLGNGEVDELLPGEIKLKAGASRVLTRLRARENFAIGLEFRSRMRGHDQLGPSAARGRE